MSTKILLLLTVFIFIISCNKNKKQESISVNPEFAPYISAYTGGLVSKVSPVKVVLQGDYPHAADENGLINENLLSFNPKIKGKTYLEDNQTIKFIPDEPLPQDQTFTASLDLGEIYADMPDTLEIFKFQFQVKKQDFSARITGLHSAAASDAGNYSITGKVITNDIVSSENTEKMLTAEIGGKKLPVQWQHSQTDNAHKFTISDIQATEREQKLTLNWNGKPADIDRKEEQEFIIPARGDFKVVHTHSESSPEQYISVFFSEPLNEEQFVQGLAELAKSASNDNESYDENGNNNVQNIIVDGNEMKIYTGKKLGGDYDLRIFPGVGSASGKTLQQEFQKTIQLQRLFPQVKFVGNGNIIPHTDGLFLPFEAVGLNAVRVEITKIYESNMHQFFQRNQYNGSENLQMVGKKVLSKIISLNGQQNFDSGENKTYQLELSKFVEPEPGAVYNVAFSFDQAFASFPCDSVAAAGSFLTPLENQPDSYLVDSQFSESEYYYDNYYPEGYDWSERNNPCHVSYYTDERTVSRNILASDLGVVAKIGNNRIADITVSNLLSAKPETGVEITAYDLQNQEAGKGKTDSDGFASFPLSRKPFLIKASKGTQKAYVRVDDGSSLSLAAFNVDGESMESGLAGFIYGERGVWRPGDSIHLTFVMNESEIEIPKGQPAVLEFKNPDGQIISRQVNRTPVNGFYTFGLETMPDARTGNWNAEITLGGLKFYKNVKIETIKPNRLKINTEFPTAVLSGSGSSSYQMQAQWLTGAAANNLASRVVATVSAVPTEFPSFSNFTFDDPSRVFSAEEQTIYDGSLSTEGTAGISARISTDILPPGMLQLGIFTKVFEPGGDFSSKYETRKYAPYNNFVGLHIPLEESYYPMLHTGKNYSIPVASVDMNGKPVSRDGLEVKVYRIENSWWYNADDNDLAHFVSNEYENLFASETVSTQNGRGKFDLKVPSDRWGNYFVRVCDPESGHCAGERVWIDWPDSRNRSGMPVEAASILSFEADKEKYEIGDVAQITIPSSPDGKALISIENAKGIIHKEWKNTGNGSTKVSVKITPEMAPNCYVNISLLQPHAQTVNDMPVRMYGVIPLMVEDKERKLQPLIQTPSEIRPNSDYVVSVKEQNSKPMTYTLAVVDEGLLDITNFSTPDIYGHFNRKQALGVKSWDIYNYVLGAFGGRIESVFTIGGDMAMQAQNKENISRFEPVVKFIGPFTLEKGGTNTHKLSMENYAGSVKVMVVAGNGEAFGSAEKSIFVKQALMTLTTLPRVLNPGDIVEMPVTVFAMDKKIRNVNISVENNNMLSLTGQKSGNLTFTETGDKIMNFTFQVPEKTGKATVKVNVAGNGEKAFQEIEMEVRSPNAPMTRTHGSEVTASSAFATQYAPFGMEGTNQITLQLSSLPEMRLGERLDFLLNYPHGCAEQIISTAFPQLYLADLTQLTTTQKSMTENNVKTTLNKLKNQQLSGGGMGYWPGASSADEWASNYALHFVLKAEEKGYQIPVGLKSGLIGYQQREAKHWNYYADNLSYAGQIQAYRLYSLALAGQPDLSLMNRLRESGLSNSAKWHLIAAYQLASQDEIARKMMAETSQNITEYAYNPYTYGSTLRDRAIILTALNGLGNREQAGTLMRDIATHLAQDSWYSTQTTAYALIAISEFVKNSGSAKGIKAEWTMNGQSRKIESGTPVVNIALPLTGGSFSVKNLQNSYLFATVVNSGVPMGIQTTKEQRNLNLNVAYFDLNGQPLNVTELRQGTDFRAVATLSHPGMLSAYHELALTQLFPSGWEIINTRVSDQATAFENAGLDFQDFRDDRVYSYFDLNENASIQITILLNATYAGEFDLPAAYCQAMYDNSIYALEPGKRVKVVR